MRERLRDKPFKFLSDHVSQTTLKRHVMQSSESIADLEMYAHVDSEHPNPDVFFKVKNHSPGRSPCFSPGEEKIIVEAATYYAYNNTPLSRICLLNLTQDFVESLPECRGGKIRFKDNGPITTRPYSFLKRNPTLDIQRGACLKEKQEAAISWAVLSKYFVRVEMLMERYRINHPRYIFNVDESGFSAKKLVEKQRACSWSSYSSKANRFRNCGCQE